MGGYDIKMGENRTPGGHVEKYDSWKRGWISQPIAWKLHFFRRIKFYKAYYLGLKLYWSWDRVWGLAISCLLGYRNIALPYHFNLEDSLKNVYVNIASLSILSAIEAK